MIKCQSGGGPRKCAAMRQALKDKSALVAIELNAQAKVSFVLMRAKNINDALTVAYCPFCGVKVFPAPRVVGVKK